jgi:hypothetical protein
VLRFAFVEFTDEEGARAALSLGGTMLGYYPVRVLPSKTAIVPVNPTFLPRVGIAKDLSDSVLYLLCEVALKCQNGQKLIHSQHSVLVLDRFSDGLVLLFIRIL